MKKIKNFSMYIIMLVSIFRSRYVRAYSWLDQSPKNNVFANLKKSLEPLFTSVYGLVIQIGLTIFIMVCAIIGAKIAISNGKGKQEGKEQFISFIYGVVIFACTLALVSLCTSIGRKIR